MSNFVPQHIKLVVEDHGRACLALELDTDPVLASTVLSGIEQLDLNRCLLSDNNVALRLLFFLFLFPRLDVG